jgi:hypothetical protein
VKYTITQYESELLISVRGHSISNPAYATSLRRINSADRERELSNMTKKPNVMFVEADPFGLECSACHYRFESSQGEKLRNDVIAHLWSHTSSEEDVRDSMSKSEEERSALDWMSRC